MKLCMTQSVKNSGVISSVALEEVCQVKEYNPDDVIRVIVAATLDFSDPVLKYGGVGTVK